MSESGKKILVVDDDPDVRWMVEKYLGKHDYEVETAENGDQMRQKFSLADAEFDLVLLDIYMPGEDGLTLARYLRANFSVGIIMLTAAKETVDRIVGLEVGADDYVTKPFEPRELLARIKSVLRRVRFENDSSPKNKETSSSQVPMGNCVLDLDSHKLCNSDEKEIAITKKEFDLLRVFSDNPDKILSRDRLFKLAHNRDWDPYDRSIDIRIARIRSKIESDPSKPQVIKTVRGVGYMFNSQGM